MVKRGLEVPSRITVVPQRDFVSPQTRPSFSLLFPEFPTDSLRFPCEGNLLCGTTTNYLLLCADSCTASGRFAAPATVHGMPRLIKGPYTVPSDANHTGVQLLRDLVDLPRREYQRAGKRGPRDLSDEKCLEFHAKRAKVAVHKPGKGMFNSEYIIAQILKSQNHSNAVPEGWLQPRDKGDKLPAQPLVLVVPEPPVPEAQEAPVSTR